MAITEATIRQVKYPPESIPDAWFGTLALNAEFAPPVLDVKRYSPYIVILNNLQVPANALAVLRARYDGARIEENTAAILSLMPGAWWLPAKDTLYYNIFGLGVVANYTSHFNVWAFLPTIAHKLFYGIALTNDEKTIADELGVKNTVDKGLLPLPISQLLQREYHIVGEETHSRSINIAVAATIFSIETIYAKPGEFIVLTRIAANPGAAGPPHTNIRFIVDRDNDANLVDLPTFPLSLIAGGEISCFIPATREIRLTTTATVAPGAHLFRYTYQRIRLNNILRLRFGLASEDEVPKDLAQKVKAGIV